LFNICSQCGKLTVEPEAIIEEESYYLVCSNCGAKTKFKRYPLYLILGASGTGKTTLCRKITGKFKDYITIDVDVFLRKEFDKTDNNFIEFKNYCLNIANNLSQNGSPVLFFLQGIPNDFENSSERKFFTKIHYLFLVCDEEELLKRLQKKFGDSKKLTENRDQVEEIIKYNRKLKEIAEYSDIMLIDSSKNSMDNIVIQVYNWLKGIS
jgi:RNase adaptor protein for sRNA GlmZ degradation